MYVTLCKHIESTIYHIRPYRLVNKIDSNKKTVDDLNNHPLL